MRRLRLVWESARRAGKTRGPTASAGKAFLSRLLLLGFLTSPVQLQAQASMPTAATAIWFGAADPVVQNDRHTNNPADYMTFVQARCAVDSRVGACRLSANRIPLRRDMRWFSHHLTEGNR
jgi:hypothetical protein